MEVEKGLTFVQNGVRRPLPGSADMVCTWNQRLQFTTEQLRLYTEGDDGVESLTLTLVHRPSRAKPAPHSLRRALLMPLANPGSLYRCGRST